jgi:hypothetical protein
MKKIFYTHLCCLLLLLTGFASFTAQAQSDGCAAAPTLVLTNGAACTTYDINSFGLDGTAALSCTGSTRNMDAWSRFTAVGTSTTITFTSSNNRDVALVVYNTGTCTPTAGTQIGCVDAVGGGAGNIETVTVATVAGNPYLVRVVRVGGNQRAQGDLCVVANDICSNPIALTVGAACVTSTSNGATDNASGGGNVCDGSTTNRTVWYRFQATATSHNVNLTGVGGAYDAVIDVYSGACGTLGASIGCIDGGGNGGSETLLLTGLTVGNFYLVRISGYGNGNSGDFCINVTTPVIIANDLCTGAVALTVDAACTAGTTVGATNSTNPTGATNFTCDGTATDRTVWYSFVATAPNHTINLTAVGAGYDAVMHTYSGTCAGGLTQIACEDINGNAGIETEVLTGLTVGTTYFIRISGYGNGVAGTFCLQVVTTPPTNDTCAAATNLTVDATCINGYTIGATNNTAPTGAACGVAVTDRTVWYTFTATAANQTVNLTNLTAAYDAVINVYSGACGALAAVNCTIGSGAGGNETLALTGLTAGTVYRIRISGNGNGNAGSFCINVTQPAPTNDICSAATTLTLGAACVNGTTIGATNNATPAGSVNFACDGTTATNRTVWYSFTASAAASHTITLNNNTALYDAVINVYSGTCAGGLTPVASGCANVNGNGVGEALTLTGLTNGTIYFVRISGFGNNNAGDFCLQVTTAPNDVCTTATVLASNTSCVTTAGSTIGATAGAAGCTGTADDDVWYSFTARTATHTVTVTPTGGSAMANAVVELFSGTCAGLTSLSCANTTTGAAAEVLTFSGLIIGNTYFVRVYSFANATGQGNFTICVTHTAPVNDNCANATVLTPTAFCSNGTVIGATNEPANDLASCLRTEQTVWYQFVATQSTHVVRIQNSTSNFDLSFALYTGTCGALALVAGSCINGGGNGAVESNTFTGLTVGTTYFVRVHNAITNSQGDFCIQVYNVNPPNDNCETPTPLTMNALCANGDNTNATTGTNNGPVCGDGSTTLWYSFVATQTSHYIELSDANTGSGTIDGAFIVLTGACGSLTTIATCRDLVGAGATESNTITGLTVGVTYLVRISSATATRGNLCVRVAAAPVNNNCTGAVTLTVNAPCTTGTTILATTEAATISCSNNTKSVWYRFTATATTHTVTVNNVTGFDVAFALYNNTCGTPTQLTPLGNYCQDVAGVAATETNSFTGLTIGTTYLIMVTDDDGSREGNFCIQVTGPPTNDLCSNATALTVNGNCTSGTNNLATNTAGEPVAGCINSSATVWYTFTATNTSHTVNLTNGSLDFGFAVYSGSCAAMTLLGACQDANTGSSESATFTTVINTQYWIRVAGNAVTDLGTFCIQVISPPINDFCSGATALTMNYPCVLGQNTGATGTPAPNPAIACGNNSQTVWYSFVATQTSHRVSAFPRSTGANTDFVLNVFSSSDNTCSGTLNSLGCLDGKTDGGGEEGIFTGLTVGNRYYVVAAGDLATDQANFCISVTQDSDLCANAVPLSVNSECVAGSNTSATVTAGETTTCAGAVSRAMWFSFVPTSSTTTLNTQFNPDADGRITVFNATGTCTGMTQINCSDNAGNGGTEQLVLNQLSVGRTYYVMVDAVGGTAGAFCIRATSQVPCGTNPEPSDECDTAPLVSNLNGYCGVTSTAYTANNYNNLVTTVNTAFCNSGATIQNNSFLRFTAASTTATFNLNVVSSAPFGGKPCTNGLQMQVFSVSGGNCRTGIWSPMPGSVVGGTSPGGTCINTSGALGVGTITVTITSLIPGQIYYIMFDGASGQECGYALSTLEGAGFILPATLLNFSARGTGSSNILYWATSSELNVDYFQIDRSYNGMQFENIGKVSAAGNSNKVLHYDFVDTKPLQAENFYRLTIFDKDHTRSFSKIIQLSQEKTEFSLLNLYPNPTNQEITASIFSKAEGKGLVEVLTIDGRVVMQAEKDLQINQTELVFDVKNLVAGVYILKITSSVTGTTVYQRFVKF